MTIEEVVGTRGRISKIEKVRDAVRVVNKALAIAHGVHETGRKGDPLRRCRRTIGSCHHRLRIDLTRVTGRGVSRMAAATLGYGAVNEAAKTVRTGRTWNSSNAPHESRGGVLRGAARAVGGLLGGVLGGLGKLVKRSPL